MFLNQIAGKRRKMEQNEKEETNALPFNAFVYLKRYLQAGHLHHKLARELKLQTAKHPLIMFKGGRGILDQTSKNEVQQISFCVT